MAASRAAKTRRRWTQQINGETWTIKEVTLRTLWRHYQDSRIQDPIPSIKAPDDLGGLCDWGARVIHLREGLSRDDLREIVAHEILHAQFPKMPHRRIGPAAVVLAEALSHV